MGTQLWLLSIFGVSIVHLVRQILIRKANFANGMLCIPLDVGVMIGFTTLTFLLPWGDVYQSGVANILLFICAISFTSPALHSRTESSYGMQIGILSAALVISISSITLLGVGGLASRDMGLSELGPNTIGFVSACGVVSAISLSQTNKIYIMTIALKVIALLLLTITILTFSKTTIIALLIAAVVGALLRSADQVEKTVATIVALSATSALIYIIFYDHIEYQLALYLQNDSLSNASGRTILWDAILSQLDWKQFLFGSGYGAARSVAEVAGYAVFGILGVSQSHNAVVEAIVNTGLIGAAVLFTVLIKSMVNYLLMTATKSFSEKSMAIYGFQIMILLSFRAFSEGSIAQTNTSESVLLVGIAVISHQWKYFYHTA